MARTPLNQSASARPRRAKLGVRNVLTVNNKEPGYHYRITNLDEDNGRVQRLLDIGYEIVPDATVGDKRVDNPSSLGSAKIVSVGGGRKAVVMRQLDENYKEDQLAKQAEIDEQERLRAADPRASGADYGKVEFTR